MLWEVFFLGLLIIALLYCTRKRRKDEPPLDKGWIPLLGHALAFGKDALLFLAQMKEKHGDIFTVRLAGRYVTVLLDSSSFDAVLNDTVSLDLSRSRNLLLKKIFLLQLPDIKASSARKWNEQHFAGAGLTNLCTSMHAHVEKLLLSEVRGSSPSEWRQDGLFSLCYSLLFRSGYLTLFGRQEKACAAYGHFRQFDSLLSKLARGTLKREEMRAANLSRERLWELLSPTGPDTGSDWGSDWGLWQRSYHRFLHEEGADAETRGRATLFQLWTTQCNNGPAAFWLLGFLLTHPEAMEALQSEIRSLPSMQHGTPVFDSILTETLRLRAAVMIRREVVREKVVHVAGGQQYRLRRGDIVALFPLLSPQMDPEIHQEPQCFKYDRFLNDTMTAKVDFYKSKRRVKYYTMPFGAGPNVCAGKKFAMTSIKQFVFLFLTHFDVELCDPEAQLPPVNSSRYGFGMLQPDGDLQIRYRPKRIQPEM